MSLMFGSHRNGLQRHGESGDKIQGNPLDTRRVNPQIRHSHRHDDMQFMILSDEELVKFSDHPVFPGVTAKLMRTDEQAKGWRNTVSVGCKHCIPNQCKPCAVRVWYLVSDFAHLAATSETEATPDGQASKPHKKSKAFKFGGLRSHLKEK